MTLQCQMEHFSPGPDMGRELRGALSRFGTGVTVVTAQSEAGPVGITANSFSSVSLDPPLVLWSAAKSSSRFPHFTRAEHMAIHVLAEEQMPVARAFAASAHGFDQANWSAGAKDLPLLDGCLARFECERYAEYDGGDHAIIVARVLRASVRQGEPLLFFGGRFGNFAAAG
ncbi:MAG: flavin reductase family protein [Alterinioella nitratireducens]|uniref:flavin reductase family protein n=1 Tax=Alterinioella nitratireducens TaxID=2735915 RepID=UPI000C3878E1|nr:flavin oxidoreductase [Nioella sp.]